MPVSLQKGQKVSLTKGNPGLKNVVVPKSVEYVGNDALLNVENVVYK